jgi:hypothetical protein
MAGSREFLMAARVFTTRAVLILSIVSRLVLAKMSA